MLRSPFHRTPLSTLLALTLLSGLAPAQDAKPDPKPEAATVDGKTAAGWIKHLAHVDYDERQLAIDKLLEFDDPPIAELAAAKAEDKAFGRKYVDQNDAEHDLLDGLEEVVFELDLDALPGLIRLLEHKDERTRAAAAHYLGMLRLAGASEWKVEGPLRKLLDDKQAFVRETAAAALGQIEREDDPDPKTVDALKERIQRDPDALVRVSAAVSLMQIEGSDDQKPKLDSLLIKALSHEDPAVRAGTARALAGLGQSAAEALPELRKLAADKDAFVRLAAATADWDIAGEPAAAPALLKLLDASEATVREIASLVLGEMAQDLGAQSKTARAALRKRAEEDPSRRVRAAARDAANLIDEAAPAEPEKDKPKAAPET